MRNDTAFYDLVFLDLTNSGGRSTSLYASGFFKSCALRLTTGRLLALHLASPGAQQDKVRHLLSQLRAAFPQVQPFQASVPVSGGPWLMAVCGQQGFQIPTLANARKRLDALVGDKLRIFSPGNLAGLLALPAYIEQF